MEGEEQLSPPRRKVGLLLGVGILFLPYVFVWALLRSGHSVASRIIGFIWLWVVVVGIVSGQQTSGRDSERSSTPRTVVAEPQRTWQYHSTSDEMRGTKSRFAELESDNSLDFDFPYNGGSRGHLILRRDPRSGLNVMLRMDKGQFAGRRESVSARFDAGPIITFTTSEPTDNRTGLVFLAPEQAFLRRLRASKRLILEAEFYQEGARQIRFTTAGLDPKW